MTFSVPQYQKTGWNKELSLWSSKSRIKSKISLNFNNQYTGIFLYLPVYWCFTFNCKHWSSSRDSSHKNENFVISYSNLISNLYAIIFSEEHAGGGFGTMYHETMHHAFLCLELDSLTQFIDPRSVLYHVPCTFVMM